MVARGYNIERAVNIVAGIFGLTLSLLQFIICMKSANNLLAKKRIHSCGVLSLFFWILANIDPRAVYGIFPVLVVEILAQLALDCLTGGVCFIIYSHFQVHYSSLRREVPKYLAPCLKLAMCWLIVMSTTMHVIEHTVNLTLYGLLESIVAMIFVFFVLISDLYGYFLIRRVLQELQRAIMESLAPKQLTKERSSVTDHHKTLNRIFRFHCVVCLLLFIDLLERASSVSSNWSKKNDPPKLADPYQYSINIAIFPVFLVWLLQIWWAWVPFSKLTQNENNNNNGTNRASTYNAMERGGTGGTKGGGSSKHSGEQYRSDSSRGGGLGGDQQELQLDSPPTTPSRQGHSGHQNIIPMDNNSPPTTPTHENEEIL